VLVRSFLIAGVGFLLSIAGLSAQTSATLRSLELFDELPPQIQATLEKIDCVVPQASFFVAGPHNVVRGEFAEVGQEDWAVLCSKDGASSIHVVFGGPSTCPSPIRPIADRSISQSTGPVSGYQFSRLIDAVPELRSSSRPELRAPFDSIAYSGLADLFVEKGGEILACIDGVWHSFAID
jgi:hypothetical protein